MPNVMCMLLFATAKDCRHLGAPEPGDLLNALWPPPSWSRAAEKGLRRSLPHCCGVISGPVVKRKQQGANTRTTGYFLCKKQGELRKDASELMKLVPYLSRWG